MSGSTADRSSVWVINQSGATPTILCVNDLSVAASESVPAHEADDLRTILRHVRIPPDRVETSGSRSSPGQEFAAFPGDTGYGFVAGLYPTDHPTLPEDAAVSS